MVCGEKWWIRSTLNFTMIACSQLCVDQVYGPTITSRLPSTTTPDRQLHHRPRSFLDTTMPLPPPPSTAPSLQGGPELPVTSHFPQPSRKHASASTPRMEEFLKSWRQDALNKHQYDAAIFIGDKLLALTGRSSSMPPKSELFRGVHPASAMLTDLSSTLQVTRKTPSGSLKCTLVPGTTTAPKRS